MTISLNDVPIPSLKRLLLAKCLSGKEPLWPLDEEAPSGLIGKAVRRLAGTPERPFWTPLNDLWAAWDKNEAQGIADFLAAAAAWGSRCADIVLVQPGETPSFYDGEGAELLGILNFTRVGRWLGESMACAFDAPEDGRLQGLDADWSKFGDRAFVEKLCRDLIRQSTLTDFTRVMNDIWGGPGLRAGDLDGLISLEFARAGFAAGVLAAQIDGKRLELRRMSDEEISEALEFERSDPDAIDQGQAEVDWVEDTLDNREMFLSGGIFAAWKETPSLEVLSRMEPYLLDAGWRKGIVAFDGRGRLQLMGRKPEDFIGG